MYESVYEVEDYDTPEYDSFYGYEETEGDVEEEGMTAYELLRYCVHPTVISVYTNLFKLFGACLVYRLIKDVLRCPERLVQWFSAVSGMYMLWLNMEWLFVQSLGLALSGFFFLRLSSLWTRRYRGFSVSLPIIVFLVACELFSSNPEQWSRVRGTQMMISMRVISLAFDLDWRSIEEPVFLDYMGYTFCVATSMFGPWIPYAEYKGAGSGSMRSRLLGVFASFFLSLVAFTLSNCWIEWLIPPSSHVLWSVYRQALLFRTSQYFVCYTAETSLGLSGLGSGGPITRPKAVELPHSLVSVVVNWNLPVHRWLKTYVFRNTRGAGGFVAVMCTYLSSALLHGLNCRLAAVLLSLGLYTYAEYSLREKLASRFSACLSARPCPSLCSKHRRRTSNLLVNTVNLIFSALAIFHLAYLGVLVDPTKTTTCSESFVEWQDLNFVSHWVALATYIVNILI